MKNLLVISKAVLSVAVVAIIVSMVSISCAGSGVNAEAAKADSLAKVEETRLADSTAAVVKAAEEARIADSIAKIPVKKK